MRFNACNAPEIWCSPMLVTGDEVYFSVAKSLHSVWNELPLEQMMQSMSCLSGDLLYIGWRRLVEISRSGQSLPLRIGSTLPQRHNQLLLPSCFFCIQLFEITFEHFNDYPMFLYLGVGIPQNCRCIECWKCSLLVSRWYSGCRDYCIACKDT